MLISLNDEWFYIPSLFPYIYLFLFFSLLTRYFRSLTTVEEQRSNEVPHLRLSQCLLTMSAGLFSPFMWKNRIIFPAIASRTLWYDSALCLFVSAEWGMVKLLTTDSLSPNMYVDRSTGTPRYRSVVRRSMIWSVAIRAATNSLPYVAVSTVACLFEYQSIGV